jgi:hypothetical protein
MFVYGEAGRKAPYSIKLLTALRLSELFLNKTKPKYISIKNLSYVIFMDSTRT